MKFKIQLEKKEIDMTPMIDMSFLLIAFFMILINFTEADQNERIRLPVSELAIPPDEVPTQTIMLQVLENGNTIYNNAEYDLEGLGRTLEFHKRFLDVIGVKQKTVNVVVRADMRCESGKVQDVIDLCLALRFENFKLRAKQDDR